VANDGCWIVVMMVSADMLGAAALRGFQKCVLAVDDNDLHALLHQFIVPKEVFLHRIVNQKCHMYTKASFMI
jgi:hypothetical protein